ncbi:cytochrome-c oxidase [Pseudomonas agarici]|uniref:Cytochrome-c oxidase n=2 Tax=Pseudomonas agarici TaxID=46677 RepID=A0A0X1T0W3_PSEAA|nr:cytochrome-c oxidase [Pseudomonas agarici]NWB91006.1 cbb3-type cytochrome c oxidase subunit 3 [Pseudomonas agarici]NWC09631.1 cbb3-type cytochrome c oxidase subunit 3 [Pseudomonas agarici]
MIRGLGTLLVMTAFAGLAIWVFSAKRNPEFAQARMLPFADEPSPETPEQDPATRSNRP